MSFVDEELLEQLALVQNLVADGFTLRKERTLTQEAVGRILAESMPGLRDVFEGMIINEAVAEKILLTGACECMVFEQISVGVVGLDQSMASKETLVAGLSGASELFPGATTLLNLGFIDLSNPEDCVDWMKEVCGKRNINFVVLCGSTAEEVASVFGEKQFQRSGALGFGKYICNNFSSFLVHLPAGVEEDFDGIWGPIGTAMRHLCGCTEESLGNLPIFPNLKYLAENVLTRMHSFQVCLVSVGFSKQTSEKSVKNDILCSKHLGCRSFQWLKFDDVLSFEGMFQSICEDKSVLSNFYDVFVIEALQEEIINHLLPSCQSFTRIVKNFDAITASLDYNAQLQFVHARTSANDRAIICLPNNNKEGVNQEILNNQWDFLIKRAKHNPRASVQH